MSKPQSWSASINYTAYATANSSAPFPPASLDTDFANLATTISQTLANLALIQRDDGQLANGCVNPQAFSTEALNLMGSWTVRGAWLTGTLYNPRDLVSQGGASYVCVTQHIAGTFATDLSNGLWVTVSAGSAQTLTTTNNTWSGTNTFSAAATFNGAATLAGATSAIDNAFTLKSSGTPTNTMQFRVAATGAGAWTFPSNGLSDTFVGVFTTQTVTNKTFSGTTINGGSVIGTSGNPNQQAAFSTTWGSLTPFVVGDFIGQHNGASVDVTGVRGYAQALGSASSVTARGVQAQVQVPAGVSITKAYALDVGLHSQVGGTGNTTVGVNVTASHTNWLASGVQADIGVYVNGEDGWKTPFRFDGVSTSTLFQVDSAGSIYSNGKIFAAASPTASLKTGVLQVPSAPGGETWAGFWYDTTINASVGGLRVEALQAGTGYHSVYLCPAGANVVIGGTTDDASGANLQVFGFARFGAGTALAAGGAAANSIRIGPIGSALGVFAGSGAPTLSASKGSLYLRSDGSATNNRAYINTDGGTTWTALTTAA